MKKENNETITQLFIEAIENGFVDGKWIRPWDIVGSFMPSNPVTKNTYRGINALILMTAGGGYFAGYGQWQKVDGQVRKGEKGITITIPMMKKFTDNQGNEETRLVAFKLGKVFASDQQDGWVNPNLETINQRFFNRIVNAEQFIDASGASITYNSDRAFYTHQMDKIVMPQREQFEEPEHFYATILHELVHWTGHKSRLNRLDDKSKHGYAYEELVAELGASFLCAELGIHQGYRDDHAKYIKGWLDQMRGDSTMIVDASKQAQQAVDYLKGLQSKQADDTMAA